MIEKVVGEYAGDYGFLLPKPVSLQMRILGAKRHGVETPDQIQLREYSRGGGTDDASYITSELQFVLERQPERQREPELERVERRMEVRVFPQLSSYPAFLRGFCVPRAALTH